MNIYNKCSSYKLNIKKAQYGNHSHDSKQVSPGHLLCWSILLSCHTVNDVKPWPFLQKMVSWRCPMTFLNHSLHIVVHLGHIFLQRIWANSTLHNIVSWVHNLLSCARSSLSSAHDITSCHLHVMIITCIFVRKR